MTKQIHLGLVTAKVEGEVARFDDGAPLADVSTEDDNSGFDIVLSSGRRIYANGQIVGIGPDLDVHEGCDGSIPWPGINPGGGDDLTSDDMRELADIMIERWIRFKATVTPADQDGSLAQHK